MPLNLTIPDSIADGIRLPEDRLPTELLSALAVALYAHGPLSFGVPPSGGLVGRPPRHELLAFGKARELAGLGKYEFSQLLAARAVTRHYTPEELQDDLDYAELMKKASPHTEPDADRDTLRPEYDFSRAVRGATAARYAQGANVVVIDPDLLDVFPDSAAVNATLRALAPVLRQQRRARHAPTKRLTRATP